MPFVLLALIGGATVAYILWRRSEDEWRDIGTTSTPEADTDPTLDYEAQEDAGDVYWEEPVPESYDTSPVPDPGFDFPRLGVYAPRSPEAVALFRAAANFAGFPLEWADPASPDGDGLHSILARESKGYVGIPNLTYLPRSKDPATWPAIWAELRRGKMTGARITSGPSAGLKSSATGLGQLTLTNIRLKNADGSYKYYPSGPQGIGDPFEEAIGMLRYMADRYGSPANARAGYGKQSFGHGY